ncbi:hypothetical protein BE08_17755 [Sorangium cellulosum]|uniref:DUF4142 domain-containing protein n=1 Tax=Sorangium cellulosum TaxID=56 RepID=A0A150PGB6_SORCE|nr:hypothetical protein BE08_17755 [Sorangium cellulosum]
MLRNRSGRLAAIMFAGSFVLAGAGGCIAGADDEAETDGESTAGGESNARENTGADGRSGGQTGGDRARRAGGSSGGRQSGGEQADRQGERAGRQGEQAGCHGTRRGEQAGFQGGRRGEQGGRQGDRQGGDHSARRQMSDQQIATLFSVLNQREVELSEIAVERAESPEVQRYAEQRIDEHARAEQHGVRLSRGERTSIEACPQCEQLQDSAVEARESLQEQEGAEFDVGFMWAQVSLHRRALEILDEPHVKSSEIIQIRSRIEQHLREAEQIFCALLQRQQQQSGQKGAQQQGPQSAQQHGPQSAQQHGPQSAQQQGPQSAQQHGPQSAQQRGQQQRDQLQGPQRGQQQRGQQRGGQMQGQQSAQQQGPQSAQQQGSGQRGSQP